jgi:KDO2-lipid IV(A) lauroyltransferase
MLAVDSYFYFFSLLYQVAPRIAKLAPETRVASIAARLHYRASSTQRQRVVSRLSRCLGEDRLSPRIAEIACNVFKHRWVKAEPNALLGFTRGKDAREDLSRSVRLENFERITEALEKGKGAILWGSFFGQPVLARAVLSHKGLPVCHLHEAGREEPPDWMRRSPLRRRYRAAEEQLVAMVVDVDRHSLGYLKAVIAWLSENRVVLVNATGRNGHAFVKCDFLGEPRLFATGGVSLARSTGAPILPIFCFTDEEGVQRLVVEEPIELSRSGDRQAATAKVFSDYTDLLERYIRRFPEQWPRWHIRDVTTIAEGRAAPDP